MKTQRYVLDLQEVMFAVSEYCEKKHGVQGTVRTYLDMSDKLKFEFTPRVDK